VVGNGIEQYWKQYDLSQIVGAHMKKSNKLSEKNRQKSLAFIHTSDLHLDSTFFGISEIDPELGKNLLKSTFQAYDSIINLCIEKNVDFLLIAGDVYDGANKSLYAQLKFLDGLKKLTAAGISVYIAHGNHDPLNGWSASLDWPDNVNIMSGDAIEPIYFKKNGKIAAHIIGISYPTHQIWTNLAKKFPKRNDNDPFTIGLLHCTVGSCNGHEPYAPCTVQNLKELNYNYWALGHIHTPSVVNKRDPVIIYPGNPQGRHTGELGPRGCFYITVDHEDEISMEFIKTDSIRWSIEEISIEEIETEGELIEKIREHIDTVSGKADGRSVICRYILSGRGQLHRTLAKEGMIDDILQHLREEIVFDSQFVWIERIVNNTHLPVDRNILLKRKDFIGDIVNIVEGLYQDEKALKSLMKSLDPLFSSAQGRKLLQQINQEELVDLLRQAENLLLDNIIVEEEYEDRYDSY